jgi:dTDP-4-dehydrorhamnose reductase
MMARLRRKQKGYLDLKALVIGNLGMLARDLCETLERQGHGVVGVDLPDLDITREDQVLACLRTTRPKTVINCAAFTNVDAAESEPALCHAVNREGALNIAKACSVHQVPMIHVSTDYVFDGSTSTPYEEDDAVAPLGVYGMSKWQGEEAVRSTISEHFIVRTAWLFGIHGRNFVKTILTLARTKAEIRVVADQEGCPTWTQDLAETLCRFVTQIEDNCPPIWGTYHYCGRGITNWHAFAETIIEVGRSKETLVTSRVVPITTAEYPTAAKRPQFSALECRKIEMALRVERPAWQDSLQRMMEKVYKR